MTKIGIVIWYYVIVVILGMISAKKHVKKWLLLRGAH